MFNTQRRVDTRIIPVRPVSRDDVLFKSQLRLSNEIHEKARATLIEDFRTITKVAEWFDFGLIDVVTLLEAAEDALPFLDAGLVYLPHDNCIFRARLITYDPEVEVAYRELLLVARTAVPPGTFMDYPMHAPNITDRERGFGRVYGPAQLALEAYVIGTQAEDIVIASAVTVDCKLARHATENEEHQPAHKIMLAFWLMLNTKNIATRVHEPDAKLNRARIKAGKPILQRVTYVNANQYLQALDATQEMERARGAHASPRMHLRRAHLRQRYGRTIPVRATIVNAREGAAPKREMYVVKPVQK